jgi:hypothetical protein
VWHEWNGGARNGECPHNNVIIKFTQASLDSSLPSGVALSKMEGLAQEVTQNISQISYGARLQARQAGHL